jgi:hypothetical protein
MGSCCSITTVFSGKPAVQAPVPAAAPFSTQSMPAGELTTRPPPREPACATTDSRFGTKVAVTILGASMVVWQVARAQSPLKATKTEVGDGTVWSVTTVPALKRAVHVPLAAPALMSQSIPVGVDITLPLPLPLPDTDSATVLVTGSVMAAAFLEPPPEQADIAVAARTADRTCRAACARTRQSKCEKVRMAERE